MIPVKTNVTYTTVMCELFDEWWDNVRSDS